ncbi:MAG: 5'-nucleotidase C-terminal domain-containing protein, partial [Cetobacterium sp.]
STGAEIAITNGGGIRSSIKTGDITKGDLISVLPFGNFIVTKYLTGAEIKDIIEHGIKDSPNAAGQFPHVAGFKFVYDEKQPAGSRIIEITFNNKPLEMDKKYLVATNDFMSAGGDGYPHFKEANTENEFSALDEALREYVEKLGTVDYKVEGRITKGTKQENIVVGKVSNIEAVETTSETVKLTWSAPENPTGLVGYVIYKDGKELTTISSDNTEYTVEKLRSNTIYGFKVS